MNTSRLTALLAFLISQIPACSHAAPLTAGNILVSRSSAYQLVEFTPAGAVVQTFNIPSPGAATEYLRDAVVGLNGIVYLYNGTFDPVVTILNPTTGVTSDRS
jgi:hypothetical protein